MLCAVGKKTTSPRWMKPITIKVNDVVRDQLKDVVYHRMQMFIFRDPAQIGD